MIWLAFLLVGVAGWGLTGAMRRYALARSLMDIPNTRSSHVVPTPRGGGLAIVIAFLPALPILALYELVSWSLAWALLGAGVGVAVLGFFDDHRHIAARWRLLGHFCAAAWVIFQLNGLAPLLVAGIALDLGWLGHGLALIYLVWMLNLFNFMDGIDGIASVEAICVCLGGALLYGFVGIGGAGRVELLLACAVSGFLWWNFPRAHIFMGDVGSGFLGVVLGTLSLQAAWLMPQFLWGWLILLAVFIVDATFTLLRRLLQGKRIYQAHRSHTYQHAARRYGRHVPVTLVVGLINLGWLLPIALAVAVGALEGVLGVLIAYLPLVLLAIGFRAGSAEVDGLVEGKCRGHTADVVQKDD